MGRTKGAYVIGTFDCCRANFTPPAKADSRGVGTNDGSDDSDEDDVCNCFLTFGCMAGLTVSGVSTLAVSFIEKLKSLCTLPDQSIEFPSQEFFTWTPGNDGHHLPKYKNILQFRPPAGGNPTPEE